MPKRKKSKSPSSGSGATSPATSPKKACPTSHCSIVSETFKTSPSNRARKRIGVGEEVKLTVTPGPATWLITSGSGRLSKSSGTHTSIIYTAGDTGGSVTIRAANSACNCDLTFIIIEPSNWTMERNMSKGIRHQVNHVDCGWKGLMYIHPNDVNFYKVETREMDSQYIGTGSYSGFVGDWHGNYPLPTRASSWFPIVTHNDASGSTDNIDDTIYTGDPGPAIVGGTSPPFNVGSGHFPITMEWKVGTGTPKSFPVTNQEDKIFANGRCESRKGSHTEHTMYNWPTTSY